MDDGPRAGTTIEAVSQLKPVFRPDGTVTAGNCCPLNDGAAAVIVMSDTRARELGIEPLARVVATGVSALSPEIMGLGPVEATKQALGHADMPDLHLGIIMKTERVIRLRPARVEPIFQQGARAGSNLFCWLPDEYDCAMPLVLQLRKGTRHADNH